MFFLSLKKKVVKSGEYGGCKNTLVTQTLVNSATDRLYECHWSKQFYEFILFPLSV